MWEVSEPLSVASLSRADFEDAIFISYTHVDNEPFGPDERRWITHLHQQLSSRVHQLFGQPLTIWRDEKLQGNDVFSETLLDRLSKVAVLVTVCSPRYLHSAWCRRELDAFVNSARLRGGVAVGTKSRLFKVLKTPVLLHQLPDSLVPLLGYEFYEYLPDDHHVREFLLNPDPEQRWKFYARVDDLAQDIASLLEEMVAPRGSASSDVPTDAGVVYLAEVASDMAEQRDNMKRELERRGHQVLPDRQLPLTGEELTTSVTEALSRSHLSIHLLGARYGARPEGDSRSVSHLQLDLARRQAIGGETFHQLIWLADRAGAPEVEQATLIAELESADAGSRVEVVRSAPEAFKAHVLFTLGRATARASPPETTGETRIYVVHEHEDRQAVASLRAELEARGHVVMLPLGHGTETEIREVHETSMVVCDAVLIVYGGATEHWVRMKLFDLVKARGWGRTAPFQAKAVWLAAPDTLEKRAYTTAEAEVLDADGGGGEGAALAPFLARLGSTAIEP